MIQNSNEPLILLKSVSKHYLVYNNFLGRRSRQILHALDEVDLEIRTGEVMGLVGESGCGKSTLGLVSIRLEKPTAGQVFFAGQNLNKLDRKKIRTLRKQMQIVFQNPITSLNPRLTVGSILAEPFDIYHQGHRKEIQAKVEALLIEVGLRPEHARCYPHQFSGGQRQRIAIARALALRPRLIVADEPVSSLDVSIQALILNLLMDLKKKIGLTYLLIAHDLSVVRHCCDRVAIMYLGKIVEVIPTSNLNKKWIHPYTKALLRAASMITPGSKFSPPPLMGDVPSPLNPPHACRFHTRCPENQIICTTHSPQLRPLEKDHLCACHFR